MASSLGASTAFAAEILGNHLSLSLGARSVQYSSSTTPAAAAFKPMAIFSKKKKAAPAKAKPVAMTLASKEQKSQNNEAGLSTEPEAGWSSDWVLDSGASYHACLNKEWFDTFEETYGDQGVLMGDYTMCRVTGVGTVKVKMFDGIVRTLGGVRYIPALKQNFISLGRLDSLGYGFESSRGELKVTKGSKVYMKGDLTSYNVYRLQGVTVVGGAAGSTQEDSKDTTHTTIDRKSKSFMKKRSKNVRHRF